MRPISGVVRVESVLVEELRSIAYGGGHARKEPHAACSSLVPQQLADSNPCGPELVPEWRCFKGFSAHLEQPSLFTSYEIWASASYVCPPCKYVIRNGPM